MPGIEILISGLRRRFGASEVETSVSAVIEMLTFRRLHHESIDDAIGRFEIVQGRAADLGNFQIGFGGLGWMVLNQLSVPQIHWPVLLQPFGGSFPRDEAQFHQLLVQVRRHCHIMERTHAGARTLAEGWDRPFATKNVAREHY